MNDSLNSLADSLFNSTKGLMRQVKTEEDLKIGFEKQLEPIKSLLKLKTSAQYEKSIYTGRADAVHGQVIIEYETPKSFKSIRKVESSFNQLVKYLSNAAEITKILHSVGVGFDGEQIFFVKNKNGKWIKEPETGCYEFSLATAQTLLIYLRSLTRLPFTPENLTQRFGSQSEVAKKMIFALVNGLKYWGNKGLIETYFNEWKRLFGIVYGEKFSKGKFKKKEENLWNSYEVNEEVDFQEILFSIHTYFAFLMKLIAAEIVTLRDTSFVSSISSELANISDKDFEYKLSEIENGGIYIKKGVGNFLEGDFFRWYLEALDSPELKEILREIARELSDFEPATSIVDPGSTRDLLKKLYQYLIPKEVRRHLGEYYTPDWLAELLINEVGYDGRTSIRFLDPACGSGTFLVLAIQKAIKSGREKENLSDKEILKRITANIWGFDLNPLAVIAARTNYLFALGGLVNEIDKFEIPIFLTDSVLTPTRAMRDLFSEFLEVTTSVGKFQIPGEWIKNGGQLLLQAAPLVEEMVKKQYPIDDAMEYFQREKLVSKTNEQVIKDFYNKILVLERQKKNGIWARFLKNTFAPMMAGKFDFVIGNPPWIRWDFLSNDYRKATLDIWKKYKLFSLTGMKAILGGGKKEFSMLFVYASADYYLKDKGILGFLITNDVFKTKGAGEGFRRFQLGEEDYLKVLKAHDLVKIKPFKDVSNKTAIIILQKGEKTTYPVPYFVWNKAKNINLTDKSLDEVLTFLDKREYYAKPIQSYVGCWQTLPMNHEGFNTILGPNNYKAQVGANPNPYGVFLVEIKQVLSGKNLLVRNLSKMGKKEIKSCQEKVEEELVFPAIRGKDIERWKAEPKIFVLIVQDPITRRGYSEEQLKKKYPNTYNYLLKFRDILLERSLYKKYHEKNAAPFYSQFNISDTTFARYKVVWKRMTNDLFAAVISQTKTPFGYKLIVPLDTTAFISTEDASEAYYLCSIINSEPVRDFVKSFSSEGRGFGTPSTIEYIGIPKFDPNNQLHQRLSEISKKCHEHMLEGTEEDMKSLEKQNDELVKEILGISFK